MDSSFRLFSSSSLSGWNFSMRKTNVAVFLTHSKGMRKTNTFELFSSSPLDGCYVSFWIVDSSFELFGWNFSISRQLIHIHKIHIIYPWSVMFTSNIRIHIWVVFLILFEWVELLHTPTTTAKSVSDWHSFGFWLLGEAEADRYSHFHFNKASSSSPSDQRSYV